MRNGRLRRVAAVVAGLLLASAMARTVAAAGYGTWSVNDVSKVEGNSGTSTLTFTITYTPTPTDTDTVIVDYHTTSGTAVDWGGCGWFHSDYQDVLFGAAMIDTAPSAVHTATVDVTICGDTAIEPDETFNLVLFGQTDTTTITKGTGVGTIINDDSVTTTTLASSANPSIYGDAVTFTATVTGATTPSGTVTFRNGATDVLGTATLTAGSAALTTSSLHLESNSITASYGGDATHATSTAALLQYVAFARPYLEIQKVAGPGAYDAAGQIIAYSYTVSNSGNVPMGDVSVFDDKIHAEGGAVVCPPTPSLAAGASIVCSATYSITQTDLDAGFVDGSASVTATYGGKFWYASVDLKVTLAQHPPTPTATAMAAATLPPTTAATTPSGPAGPSGELILLGLSLGLVAAWFAIGYRRQVRRS